MTTTGYGDIVPVDPFARSLANLEAVIGPFYLAITVARLVTLLLPLIKNSAPARIVNVSSAGQQPIDFDDVMLTRGYSGTRAYCQSKLAQIMFTIDLGALLEDRRGGQTGGSRWGAQSIVFSGIDGRLL